MNNENTRQNAMWQEFYYKKICIIQTYYYFLYSIAVLLDPSSFTHSPFFPISHLSSSLPSFGVFLFRVYSFNLVCSLRVPFSGEALARQNVWNVCIWIRECECVRVIAICWRLLLFLFVCCFPFPFHLMLSSPDFTLALIFFFALSVFEFFHLVVFFSFALFSSCFSCFFFLVFVALHSRALPLYVCMSVSLQKYVLAFFFIVIKMEIEHNDMQSRFIHFISIPMFVFLVVFASSSCFP